MNADVQEEPREIEMLGKLAELDLALAKAMFHRVQAAEEPADVAQLARAYQGLGRSLRMTIALRDKLLRARAEAPREPKPEPAEAPPPRKPADDIAQLRRKLELRQALGRIIWNETEGEQQDDVFDLLDQRLDAYPLPPGWGEEPLDDQVETLCVSLGLPKAAAKGWRDLPNPFNDPDEPFEADFAPNPPSRTPPDGPLPTHASTSLSPPTPVILGLVPRIPPAAPTAAGRIRMPAPPHEGSPA